MTIVFFNMRKVGRIKKRESDTQSVPTYSPANVTTD